MNPAADLFALARRVNADGIALVNEVDKRSDVAARLRGVDPDGTQIRLDQQVERMSPSP